MRSRLACPRPQCLPIIGALVIPLGVASCQVGGTTVTTGSNSPVDARQNQTTSTNATANVPVTVAPGSPATVNPAPPEKPSEEAPAKVAPEPESELSPLPQPDQETDSARLEREQVIGLAAKGHHVPLVQ
jgi:hypothetical protein